MAMPFEDELHSLSSGAGVQADPPRGANAVMPACACWLRRAITPGTQAWGKLRSASMMPVGKKAGESTLTPITLLAIFRSLARLSESATTAALVAL